jgi:hypothetical protein
LLSVLPPRTSTAKPVRRKTNVNKAGAAHGLTVALV